ncbi:MAG: Flp family type IVb pilin [Gaiellaceae bacterium]|jgi:Flp pilus assembly pilin Flp
MLKFFVATQTRAMNAMDDLRTREEGQTMAEYGVVLAVITLGIVGVLALLSDGIAGAITDVTGRLRG